MKKILVSLSIIAAVAVVVTGATGAFFSDTEASNGNTFTAGSLDLKIDSTCHYNGFVCKFDDQDAYGGYTWQYETDASGAVPTPDVYKGASCDCSWDAKDLNGDKFFDYGDLKPGDWGENTLSFHVYNNDAYARVRIKANENRENSCTEPERAPEGPDTTCTGRWCGELAQNFYVFVWVDNGIDGDPSTKGDNIYEPGEEIVTTCDSGDTVTNPDTGYAYCPMMGEFGATAESACSWENDDPANAQQDLPSGAEMMFPLVDGVYLKGDVDNNLGVAWFIPYGTNNIIQGDSMDADISFDVVQARHNDQSNPFGQN